MFFPPTCPPPFSREGVDDMEPRAGRVQSLWKDYFSRGDGIEVLKRRLPPSVVPIRVRDPLPHLPMRRR